jgi:hypothetical protein
MIMINLQVMMITGMNDTHPQVKDLLVKWQDAEINQYFNEYPTHSLQVLDIETIGNNVEGFDGQFQM